MTVRFSVLVVWNESSTATSLTRGQGQVLHRLPALAHLRIQKQPRARWELSNEAFLFISFKSNSCHHLNS